MIGIVSYGAYIPRWRLRREAICKSWGNAPEQGERAVAYFDEDSITMAVAATINCLNGVDRHAVDGLFFATTTSPYKEKLGSTIVGTAADLRRDIVTADFSNSVRAGTTALRVATDAVRSGSMKNVLVVAADVRLGEPGSSWELNCGDGAVAFLIGDSEVVAEIEAVYSVSNEMIDVWRGQDDRFIRSAEGRFIVDEGYVKVSTEAISGLMKKFNFNEKDFAKAIFAIPDIGTQTRMAKSIGFHGKNQLQDSMLSNVGNTGAAYALTLLQGALENASKDDRILLLSYGNGSDAVSVKVRDGIANKAKDRSIKRYIESKKTIDDYTTYIRWREILPRYRSPHDLGSLSQPGLLREVDANIRYHGVKCKACGTIQYPPQDVCTKCHTRNQFEKVRLSDKKGKVITYSIDHLLTWLPEKPTVATVINFEGGGRVHTFMTDTTGEEIRIDMPVEMSFRILEYRDGVYQYIWKCIPVRLT